MSEHANAKIAPNERLMLGERARSLFFFGIGIGAIGLLAGAVLGYHKGSGFQTFLFAYLTAVAFFLSIALGALFFVLMQHLCAAGWSVSVRRIAETYMAWIPWLGLALVPVLISVGLESGSLYRWALPMSAASPEALAAAAKGEPEAEAPMSADAAHADAAKSAADSGATIQQGKLDSVTLQKRIYGLHWLNPWFFIARVIAYFLIWSWMAGWYRKLSIRQDASGDPNLTRRMQALSGFHLLVFGLTLTGFAGDILMSIDPHWYSTMWAVYYFAGCALVIFAVLIITAWFLQRAGYLQSSITIEHYHDLGKYLFGFTFFWGYIAFSQYMLLWYANIPEEISWFARHGASTVHGHVNGWSWVIFAILFGQLLIPFGGLLSRHVKRVVPVLLFWAVWQLAFHALDICWIILPEYPGRFSGLTVVVVIAALIGVGGILLAIFMRTLAGQSLLAVADPRLAQSLAFQNV